MVLSDVDWAEGADLSDSHGTTTPSCSLVLISAWFEFYSWDVIQQSVRQ